MDRVYRAVAVLFFLSVTGTLMFAGGFAAGRLTATSPLLSFLPGGPRTDPAAGGTPEELRTTFAPFWEAWDLVHTQYADQPVDDVALMRGAIRGMLDALGDPHTGYMTPEEYRISMTHLDGEFEGIGATVETDEKTGYTRIVAPIAGSPAEAAGIRAGDLIIEINGEDIAGQDITTVVTKVRGPAGSTVTLTIRREGVTELLTFTITRARITIASVESRMLENNIAYIKVNSFGEETGRELRDQLRKLLAQNPIGLVLDLRSNPGGYLQTAIEVASQFIPDGVLMVERFGDGRERTFEAQGGGLATRIPLVVLIDKGSASASEIVAGAVKDRGRGTLVGETSFGKGSVQQSHTLSDGGAVRITIARWLTPNGTWIHEQGIKPDIAIELTEEDRAAKRDPQLERAVQLLRDQATGP
ncbi:MAG: S41 family peptidase [Anaerolineales bacterium]|nr:S41 family peptidase [Anaerolineales bacterium]